MRRPRFTRLGSAGLMIALGIAVAGGAYAGHSESNVPSYTGCLDKNGTAHKIKQGDTPLNRCTSGQAELHFSGGDITAVRTPLGSGLTGGSENGAVTLGLSEGYRLPQGCSPGEIPKVVVSPPQEGGGGGGAGTIPNAGSPWRCAADNDSGFPPSFHDEKSVDVDTNRLATVLEKTLPENAGGNYLIVAKVVMSNRDGDPQYNTCGLTVNNVVVDSSVVRNLPADSPEVVGEGTLTLTQLINLAGGDVVSVQCEGINSRALHRQLEIVRVGSLS